MPATPQQPNEAYWEQIKRQFSVAPGKIMMNAANLCPSPAFVLEKVLEHSRQLNRDVSFQYRNLFNDERSKAIQALADYTGAAPEEIGITRNTSESNFLVVNGLELKSGDEVILWDQNHPSNDVTWQKRAARFGFTVKRLATPANPGTVEELASVFIKAITPRTRLITFSHISNTTGVALPAQLICQQARAKGVMTLVDGAQSLGSMTINLPELGCDFFTASTHKWLMGPMENGLLYVRKERVASLHTSIIGGTWKSTGVTVDDKLCTLGQRNDPTLVGLPAVAEFHQMIGKPNVEARVRQLTQYLKEQLQQQIPNVVLTTPMSPAMSAGIVVLSVPGKDMKDVYTRLYTSFGIAASGTGGIRLSPHVYNTLADIDKVVGAIVRLCA